MSASGYRISMAALAANRFSGTAFALLFLIGCSSGPTRKANAPTYVITHAQISSDVVADAVAIQGTKISAIGKTGNLEPTCEAGCKVIDAQGRFLMPGFHDSHIHLIEAVKALFDLQISGTSPRALSEALPAYTLAHPEKTWIYGGDWQLLGLQRLPTRQDLDAIEAFRPVALHDITGHLLWVNTRALKLAGIHRGTQDPVGGRIIRDAKGDPTGLLLETATHPISAQIPQPTATEFEHYILLGQELTLALGLTSVTGAMMPTTLVEAQAYARLAQRGLLKQRSFLWGNLAANENDFQAMVDFAKSLPKDGHVQIVAFKGFVDGGLAASTAAMIDPYVGTQNRGLLRPSQETLNSLVLRANRAGFPAALHAVGDQAVKMALNAFENAGKVLGKQIANRVEHASVIQDEDFPRFARTGTVVSMQPCFMYFPSAATFPFSRTLGPERIKKTFAWKSLADAGALITFGSEDPHAGPTHADPITQMYCATQRKFWDGTPFTPEQRLDPATALRAYTLNPAIAIGRDHSLGKIAVGYEADLLILARDPRLGSARSIAENPIFLEMIAGERLR